MPWLLPLAKRFISLELGRTIVRNDTDGMDDFFFSSSGDKVGRGLFLASRQLVQTSPMRFEFSHYPLTPSHHLHAGSATLGRTARPNEGWRIHRASEGTLPRIVLSPTPL